MTLKYLFLNNEILLLYIIIIWVIIYFIEVYIYKFKFNNYMIFLVLIFLLVLLKNLIFNSISINEFTYYFNNYFIYNNFIVNIKIIMIIILIFYLIFFYSYNIIITVPIFEFVLLILISFLGLQIIIISNNLFIIFLFLELVNLCIYCLIGLNKYSNLGIEIAYKYFIQSAYSTIIGFFALSLIYISLGTLFINEIGLLLMNNIDLFSYIGIYLLILSIFFKLGLFPLHSWIADLYQGSFIIVTLYVATIPKIAYIFLFLKLLLEFNFIINNFSLLIAFITILYGSIIALYQTNLRRLIAYGSMVHTGFIIYSMSLYSLDGISSAFFYLLFYILLVYFLFGFILFLYEINEDKNTFLIENISQIGIILKVNKLITILFSFVLFSFAGLPLFIGFVSKWNIFLSLILYKKYIELFFLILISVLSLVYYIRIIRFLFFYEIKDKKVKIIINLNNVNLLLITIIFIFILNILLIFYHSIIYLYILKNILYTIS